MERFTKGQSASCSKTFTEDDIKIFAELSGDYNPIHVDPDYAKNTRFRAPIAHGLLTSSLLSQLLGFRLPGEGSIYVEQTIRFTAPVYIGDTITATGTVLEYIEEKNIIKLLTECRNQDNILVLTGTAVMMVPKEGEVI
ncbi:3-hydroxybutyryl-CoA dehydratase [Bacillus oleivorans]|uniref:3-hydroxybutyryl-CoA dehydratase n=1 Tax=Bacillus oleivorans TaxID=1448271 RepID=A0A285CQQ7_9BACI|nr:MaoC family dehydratase [Bacillus oleivorans]SNX69406.1 3-hydroxybutyryl-CoA dehydratase [Bacillus oleivorans]